MKNSTSLRFSSLLHFLACCNMSSLCNTLVVAGSDSRMEEEEPFVTLRPLRETRYQRTVVDESSEEDEPEMLIPIKALPPSKEEVVREYTFLDFRYD
ncbi:hypothetical protein GOP47_0020503 [Adiantum capillus-veneris]|uniref:Uncharacterized protein n=1 Tax=Adiantum capillus-veneris TaxID=13818 RepID=A0A9D4Z650_ADICA|nr:hypothetical protein GOP47_0020503 [Adiantum capillus-veneris]